MMKIYNLTLLSHCLPPFERLKLTTYKIPILKKVVLTTCIMCSEKQLSLSIVSIVHCGRQSGRLTASFEQESETCNEMLIWGNPRARGSFY